jgi:hypothetical protein
MLCSFCIPSECGEPILIVRNDLGWWCLGLADDAPCFPSMRFALAVAQQCQDKMDSAVRAARPP